MPGLSTEGPLFSLGSATGLCLSDPGKSHWGHTHCLPTMTVLSPQAGPPDPPPGRGGAGGILQGIGCHCFCQVSPTGSSPAPPPTPRRARLSQKHDRRGGSYSHLCPGLPPLPPGTAITTLLLGQGLGSVSSVSRGLCLCGGLGFGSQVTSRRPCLVGYTRRGFRKWVSKVPEPKNRRDGLPGSMVSS